MNPQVRSGEAPVLGMAQRQLVAGWPADAIIALERSAIERHYLEGETLFREDSPPSGFFILTSGRARISISSSTGKRLLLDPAGRGDVLGLSACISGKPYEITAEATVPVDAIFVPREALQDVLRHHPQVCVRLALLLSGDLEVAYNRVLSLRRR